MVAAAVVVAAVGVIDVPEVCAIIGMIKMDGSGFVLQLCFFFFGLHFFFVARRTGRHAAGCPTRLHLRETGTASSV